MSAVPDDAVAHPAPAGRMSRIRAGYLRRAPGLIYGFAWLVGVVTLVGPFVKHEHERVRAITGTIPTPVGAAATAVALVSGLLLLRLAAALRKRKRRAWRAAVIIAVVMVAAHLVRGYRPV